MRRITVTGAVLCIALTLACSSVSEPDVTDPSRGGSIPEGAVKVTPETDVFPPVIHSGEWEEPVPMPGPVNTAGVEDAVVISADGTVFLFFFTPDGNLPPEQQLLDGVSGIWWCRKTGSNWSEPVRALLAEPGTDHLDGSLCFTDNTLWFCSARQGNFNPIDIYTAEFSGSGWTNWQNAGQQLNQEYTAGEVASTSDGDSLYFASTEGGYGQGDLWLTVRNGANWSTPENLGSVINSSWDENQPCISSDGKELWFTRSASGMGYYGPAIFRSTRTAGVWGEPVEIVSNYAGDPGVDSQGNLYFTHLFYDAEYNKIEADIYVAYHTR